MASETFPPQPDPLSQHSQLISEHQAVDLRSPSPFFFPSPAYLEALHATALDPYKQQYSIAKGNPLLLKAIAQLYSPLINRELNPKTEVLVSAGSNACMTEIFLTFLDPGDEVILFEPVLPLVTSQIRYAGGVPVCLSPYSSAGEEAGLEFDAEKVRKAFNDRTKIVHLSSPSVCSSRLFSLAELKTVAGLCVEFDTLCVVDESFENLVFEPSLERIYSLPGMWDRTISVHSAGTLFGVPSMKVGWIIADGDFIREIMKMHVLFVFHTPTPNQIALTQVINEELTAGPKGWLSEMRARTVAARDEMASLFRGAGLVPILPVGSAYMLVDVSNAGIDEKLCPAEEMVKKGIGSLPSSVFYSVTPSRQKMISVSFQQPQSVMQELSHKLSLFKSTK